MPNPAPSKNITEHEHDHAKKAMAMIEQNHLSPSPEHYAVCFHYFTGKNKELVEEIDKLKTSSISLTSSMMLQLYHKHMGASQQQKTIDNAAHNAQQVLAEVLNTIRGASGDTKDYHKDIDQYVNKISEEFKGTEIEHLAKELVETTMAMKERGEQMNKKLEASTAEIKSLRQNLQQVAAEAQRDFLTGIFNRKSFDNLAEEQLHDAKERHTEVSLLMIDIDHFKVFNDRYGHLLGDEVLKIVARTLTELLKGRDIVARFGGEEFVVMLPETPMEGALKVAEILRAAIASKELKRKDTGEHFGKITISVGVAHFRHDQDTLITLVKRADDAMYESKRHGRNRITREGVI
jgi:diguanylate cyclase